MDHPFASYRGQTMSSDFRAMASTVVATS